MIQKIYLILFLSLFSLYADEIDKKIYLTTFQPFEMQAEPAIENQIQQSIQEKLAQKGYQVTNSSEKDVTRTLTKAKKDGFLVISGYYRRNKFGNIALYAQIYNPQTGYVVDALQISDDIELYAGLELDKEELKEDDVERIKEFSQKILIKVRSNPERKEKKESITRNLRQTPLAKKITFAIRKVALKEESQSVFQFIEDIMVVTATRSKTSIREAPAAVYVITERQIQERGYRTLVDVLKDLPGFDVQHTYGVYPDLIHQRGLIGTMQRTLAYVDGVPDNNIFENAMLGGTVRFPLDNVERIEIVAGPASALYGANAFNGVINIITKNGKDKPGHHADFTVGSWEKRYANQGYSASFSARGSVSDIQYSVGGYYYKTKGANFGNIQKLDRANLGRSEENPFYNYNYDPFYSLEKELCGGSICNPDRTAVGYYSSPYYNDSVEDTYNITAHFSRNGFRFETINWQYLAGEGQFGNGTQWLDSKQKGLETNQLDARNQFRRLGILLGILTDGIKGIPGNRWDVRNNSMLIGYLHDFSDELSLDSEVIVRQTDIINSSRDTYQNTLGPSSYYQPGDYEVYEKYARPDYLYQAEERLQWNPTAKLATIVGVMSKYVVAARDYGSYQRYTYKNYAIYIQQKYQPIRPLILTAGYRYDEITSIGKASTPRFSAVYSPTRNLTFKLLLGTAFREPSGEELFSLTPQRKPNPELKPELLRSIEFGASYRFWQRFFISSQAYLNSISNLVLEVQTQDTTAINGEQATGGNPWNQYRNVGKAKIIGVESEFSARILDNLNFSANLTYNHGEYYDLPTSLQQSPSVAGRPGDNPVDDMYMYVYKKITGKNTTITRGDIPNIAPYKGYTGFTYYPIQNLSLYLAMNWVDIRRTIATNYEKTVPGYKFFKMNIHWNHFIVSGMYFNLLVNNLSNEQFFDPGIRVADGTFYRTMLALERRNIWFKIGYKF